MKTYQVKWRWHCWEGVHTTLVTAQDEMAAKHLIQHGDSGSYKLIIGVELCEFV